MLHCTNIRSIRFRPNNYLNKQRDADSGSSTGTKVRRRGLNHRRGKRRKTLIGLGNFNRTG
jgi:hypothetical protein